MSSAEALNLAGRIKKRLPPELADFLRLAGGAAQAQSKGLYLVGGVVRDLLLERENLDLDLVVEGDAPEIARLLAEKKHAKLVTHQRFRTATLSWNGWSADLATARSESYARACALPTVKPSTIGDDLFRRDFTINAMAVDLNSQRYGALLDPYGGLADLKNRLVRVLHDKSFTDDATRIWRALRYEQRLGFSLEPETLTLLKRDVSYLKMLSGDRVRHELEMVFKEAYPENVLRRAGELSVLSSLHPSLRGDGWLVEKVARAREACAPAQPSAGLYLALLLYRLPEKDGEKIVSFLHLRKSVARIVREALDLKENLEPLSIPEWTPGEVYAYLIRYDPDAVRAVMAASDSTMVRERLDVFLSQLRHVRPSLRGEELKRMGVPQGPGIKQMLDRLLEARLEGTVSDRTGERTLVEKWLAGSKK
jgi:tRNA nucleotidyltransferase (CCA-adding enzyme)